MLSRIIGVLVLVTLSATIWLGLNYFFPGWIENSLIVGILALAAILTVALIVFFSRRKAPVRKSSAASRPKSAHSKSTHSKSTLGANSRRTIAGGIVAQEREFTLGVPVFEPPEKAWQLKAPQAAQSGSKSKYGSKPPTSQEAFFQPAKTRQSQSPPTSRKATVANTRSRASTSSRKAPFAGYHLDDDIEEMKGLREKATASMCSGLMNRFRNVCEILKQSNLEVRVWTDQQLEELAKVHLDEQSTNIEMVRLLIPANLVAINLQLPNQADVHSRLFQKLIALTGKDLGVEFVSSQKNDGRCELSFEHAAKPVRWRFSEESGILSSAFLREATQWISIQAGGRFFRSTMPNGEVGLLYLPQRVIERLDLTAEA